MAMNNNGGEFQEYQSAQNQLLNIRAQQEKILGEQRVMNQAAASTNGVLSQAAELMTQQSTTEAANFNPQTQAILSQYGLNQPRIQKSNSTQRSTQQVSKQNIVINNNYKTENTTTNNVTVPSGGPIQGRPVQINTEGKLKTWLSGVFAQQNEAAAKRDRDYEIRQANLTKDSNKLMRKLEGVGTKVGQALDPKRLAQSTINPLKGLLITLGIVKIGENIEGIMDKVDDIQNFFTEGGLVEALGGKKGEENAFQALKNLIIGEDGFLGQIKLYLKQQIQLRKDAINKIELPDIGFWDKVGVIGAIRKLGNYLGDVFKAIIDPSKSVSNTTSQQIRKTADESMDNYKEHGGAGSGTIYNETKVTTVDSKGKERKKSARSGDVSVSSGIFESIPNYALTEKGGLTGTTGSTIAQGNEIMRLVRTARLGEEQIDTTAIVEGLSRLAEILKQDNEVIIGEDFKNFLKNVLNINVGKKVDSNDYVYVIRKGGKHNDRYYQLVNKNSIKSSDLLQKEHKFEEYQKAPENLYELDRKDLLLLTEAFAGKKADGNKFQLDDIENTNIELQEKMSDFFKINNIETKNLDTYKVQVAPVAEFQNKIDKQKEIRHENWENNRGHKVVENVKGVAKDISTTAKEKITGVQEIFTPGKNNLEGDIPMGLRAAYAIKFFEDRLGLTYEQAAALVANIKAESEFKPYAYNSKGKGGGAEGLLQWTGDGNRKQKVLELFNKEHPDKKYKSIRKMTFPDQLEMISLEMEKGESLGNGKFLQNLREGKFDKFSTNIVDTFIRGMVVSGSGGKMASREQTENYEDNFEKRTNIYTALVQKYSNNKSLNPQATFTQDTSSGLNYEIANNSVNSNDYLPTNINTSSTENISSGLDTTNDVIISSTSAETQALMGALDNLGARLEIALASNNKQSTPPPNQASSFTKG